MSREKGEEKPSQARSEARRAKGPETLRRVGALHRQSLWTQFGVLFRIEMTNWRWGWSGMLLRGTLTPLLSLIALGVFARDAGPEAVVYVATGNVVVGLLFGTMDMVQSHVTFLRFDGAMDYFATLPIDRFVLILAMAVSFLLMSLPSLFITILAGPALLGLSFRLSPLLAVVVPLCTVSLAGVGGLLGLIGRSRDESLNLGFIFTLLLTAMGPVVIPPDRLPAFMRVLGWVVPSTYAASAFRQTLIGPVTGRLALDLGVLALVTVVSLGLVGRRMAWRQE